ncbi:amidohydrolase family protein [Phytohabitans sp. ZYX-F-186]|uniref:Amidohydrolase family protein n=1 Tax=Phytohabitans maris TaxID=3071409 RepID=A0ABU0ZPB9_9ACTN|nr:amidohydrolase family protein [Phytohabitans sp. ZYX-F-186]MDQ7908883.1 amidohydrolase family protein [Phytohabitans sp. ZYX-F-186]
MNSLAIVGVDVVDCTGAPTRERQDVLVENGRITSIAPSGTAAAASSDSGVVIDGAGLTLVPGLMDAHAHVALLGSDGTHGDLPWAEHVLQVVDVIGRALDEGFTTLRDACGTEPIFATLVASGRIRGPRILPSGSVLSQTGGHGDLRPAHHGGSRPPTIPGLVARPEVVDGVDAVTRMTREQLRRGATQIKMFAGGGALSPTDPLESVQFTVDEIRAAVTVARSWGTYVHTHCHTRPTMHNALDAGVRCIEHGTDMDEETADRIVAEGVFVVPTLSVSYDLLQAREAAGITPAQIAKLESMQGRRDEGMRVMVDRGVKMASGSDIVGPVQDRRGRELTHKAAVIGNERALVAATRTTAELIGRADDLGTVEVGKIADLVLTDGNPLDDIEALAAPSRIQYVLQGGRVVRDQRSATATA